MTTYIHHDSRDAKGHHRSTSWHIVKAPLAHARYYATYCRPELVADDVMTETPNAATCETCFRYEAKARDRQPVVIVDDDGSTHDELVP